MDGWQAEFLLLFIEKSVVVGTDIYLMKKICVLNNGGTRSCNQSKRRCDNRLGRGRT
jgi:hypothetical protein